MSGKPRPQSPFDSAAFGRWLARYGESENLAWSDVAERAGFSESTIFNFLAGTGGRRDGGGRPYDPPLSSLLRLANGLDLEPAFLLTKGGIGPADRWQNFTAAERDRIFTALGLMISELPHAFPPETHRTVRRMQDQILESLPTTAQPDGD